MLVGAAVVVAVDQKDGAPVYRADVDRKDLDLLGCAKLRCLVVASDSWTGSQ